MADGQYANNSVLSFLVQCFTVFVLLSPALSVHYEPNWKSIDSRPLPGWYDDSKIGIFLHWGVFSVPSFRSAWFWEYWKGTPNEDVVKFMKDNYKPDFTYADFASDFTTELFNPEEWADVFSASGARYVVLTSKHHEGFANWPSKYSWTWNSMNIGPNRDLVGSLADAIRRKYPDKIHFGLYHSLFEWFNPLWLEDKANNFTTREFADRKTLPELYELVNMYKPEVIWSDGDWSAPDVYWNSTGFLAWLYNDSPVKDTVVTNDRWGSGIACHHGGYFTCQDRYNPGVLQNRKWENAMTIDKEAWGFRRNMTIADILSMDELIQTVVETVSCGGNILINVGPTKDGRIVPIFEERLRSLGAWLKVNGEAIYETKPWLFQNDTVTPSVWYTSKKAGSGAVSVYAIVLNWPDPGSYFLASPMPAGQTSVSLLGYGEIGWKMPAEKKGIDLEIPAIPFNKQPCDYAWVFKIENLVNQQQHDVSIRNIN